MDTSKPNGLRTWAQAIFVWTFLALWLSAMTAGITGGACQSDDRQASAKLRYCTISLTAGAWMRLVPSERAKSADLRLESGIALAELGREDEALVAFQTALRDARLREGPYAQRLHQRMAQVQDPGTRALWVMAQKAA